MWGGPSLQQGDPSVSLGLTAPFTQGSQPLFRPQASPDLSCLERVDRAKPGTGVEGTPISKDRARSFRKLGPLIRHALRRATFPVGEGDLPARDALFQSVLNL